MDSWHALPMTHEFVEAVTIDASRLFLLDDQFEATDVAMMEFLEGS